MDLFSDQNDSHLCQNATTVQNRLPRIALMVNSDIGLVVAITVLITLIYTRAYKTFLQRLYIYIVVAVLINNVCNSFAYFHKELNEKSALACHFLAFFVLWSIWCIYTFLVTMILFLLVMIWMKIYRDTANVPIFQRSKLTLLEVIISLTALILPVLILCLPYYQDVDAYGYNKVICAAKTREFWGSYLAISIHSDIAGGIAAVVAVGMTVAYCTRSSKLQHAKKAIWMLISLVYVVAFFGITIHVTGWVLHHRYSFCRSPTMIVTTGILFDIYLLVYLVAFQSRMFCDSLRKVLRRRKKDSSHHLLNNEGTIEHGTAAESSRETAPSSTYFNSSYTGAFTTISTRVT